MQKKRAGRAPSPVLADDGRDDRRPRSGGSFPIVGIGASAGGLEAFSALLSQLPLDTSMSFVLVQHLDPEHDSALAQLLGRPTSPPPALQLPLNQGRGDPSRRLCVISRSAGGSWRRCGRADLLLDAEELTRFNRVAVGRELRMIELKKEINELRRQQGEPAPYPLNVEQNTEATDA